MQQTNRHPGQWLAPGQGNAEAVDGGDGEENQRDDAQDRRDDRDEIRVELEPAEKAPNECALDNFGDEEPEGEEPDEGRNTENGNVMAGEIENGVVQPEQIHALFCRARK